MTAPIPPAQVERVLVLSTAHLRESTCNTWLEHCPWACFPKGDYGWFMYATDDHEYHDIPNELKLIIEYAHLVGCWWVMFDCDGPVQDGLVTYDW